VILRRQSMASVMPQEQTSQILHHMMAKKNSWPM